ncbi:MAG: DUF11 domain-containing protein [Actinomycetota bacterium]
MTALLAVIRATKRARLSLRLFLLGLITLLTAGCFGPEPDVRTATLDIDTPAGQPLLLDICAPWFETHQRYANSRLPTGVPTPVPPTGDAAASAGANRFGSAFWGPPQSSELRLQVAEWDEVSVTTRDRRWCVLELTFTQATSLGWSTEEPRTFQLQHYVTGVDPDPNVGTLHHYTTITVNVVESGADVAVQVAADPASVLLGAPVSWTLEIRNGGPDIARNVRVAVTADSCVQPDYESSVPLGDEGGSTWSLGDLAPGVVQQIRLLGTLGVGCAESGQLRVTALSADDDPNGDNNSAAATVLVEAPSSADAPAPAAPAGDADPVPEEADDANPPPTGSAPQDPTATPTPTPPGAIAVPTPTPTPTVGAAAPTPTPTPTVVVIPPTPTPTSTPTVEPVVSPLAWSQDLIQRCRRNTDNEIETYGFTHSYIVRENVTGGRDLVEYDGASAMLVVQGDQGTVGQSGAGLSGAAVSFNTTLSAPAQRAESFTFTLTINGEQVPTSSGRYTVNSNMCVFD